MRPDRASEVATHVEGGLGGASREAGVTGRGSNHRALREGMNCRLYPGRAGLARPFAVRRHDEQSKHLAGSQLLGFRDLPSPHAPPSTEAHRRR
jgi:hypothetical protein